MILADKKGRFVYELEDLTIEEMYDWFAYYEEQYQEMERERAKHRRR